MSTIVQWASILSPIIAVIIAVYTSRRGAKDTAKQITALEESTSKQIESIKELSRNLIEASIKQVILEIEKASFFAKQAKQEMEIIDSINRSGAQYQAQTKDAMIQRFQEEKPQRDFHLYDELINTLENIKKGLISSKTKVGGIIYAKRATA